MPGRAAYAWCGEPGRVAIASDVGGFATMPAPRFGADACPGSLGDEVRSAGGRRSSQIVAQRDAVRYQTQLTSFPGKRVFTPEQLEAWLQGSASKAPNAPLSRSVAGKREFDVNLDGLAHYGMIPDFFQELGQRGAGGGSGRSHRALVPQRRDVFADVGTARKASMRN